MKISALLTIEFLESELPCDFNTLSRQKPFHVAYENSKIKIRNNSSVINVHIDKFHSLIADVFIEKSFRISEYSNLHNNVSYLLPVIVKLLVFLDEDLESYFMPYGGWEKVLNSQLNVSENQLVVEDELVEHSFKKVVMEKSSHMFTEPLEIPLDTLQMHIAEPLIEHINTDVFYATNRGTVGGKLRFGNKRSESLRYGAVNVSIPISHTSGTVERPLSLFKISLKENKKKHICIEEGKSLKHGEFFDTLSDNSEKNSLMLFIHGYNVSFNDAIYKAAQIKFDLNYEYPFVLFSWPSQGKLTGYLADKEQAIYSSSHLATLLEEITAKGIKEVLVLAHSMGSLCLAEAIKKIDPSNPKISKLALAAPDIEAQAYSHDYSNFIKTAFDKITLYASSKDKALWCSKYANSAVRLGEAGDNISVLDGVETVDMSAVDDGLFSLNHSYVSESNTALTDIHGFLINDIPAKLRRLNTKYTKGMKKYWAIH